MALITDKLRKASSGSRPVVTSLATAKLAGTNAASLSSATGWNTATAVDVTIYRKGLDGKIDATTQTDWVAVCSGTGLTLMVLRAGTEPTSGYPADALTVVKCGPTAAWADDLVQALLAQHNQDGTHSNITATSVTTPSLTVTSGVNVPANSISTAALSGNLATNRIANSYIANVYRTTTQTAAASSDTKVQFDAKALDISSQYDSTTNFRFTAGAGAGYYHIDAAVTVTVAAGDLYYATLYKNGTEVRRGNASVSSGTSESTYTVSADLSLTSSDYIEVYFHNGSAGGKSISAGNPKTYFNARLTA